MRPKQLALAAAAALAFALGYFVGATALTAHSEPASAPAAPVITERQRVWLDALVWCESGATASAVNEKDVDGTPSYGWLQFKPSTLAEFEKAYGIKGDLMSSTTQEAIVEQMIARGGVDWRHQFPDCVRKLGLPPTN